MELTSILKACSDVLLSLCVARGCCHYYYCLNKSLTPQQKNNNATFLDNKTIREGPEASGVSKTPPQNETPD